ncbi:MAG: 50S ribosomal protein L29 [Deltaproteobacteria bacterium]|nr:50S ribosomal protein L29 [Deltaproteobacteria bacterium]
MKNNNYKIAELRNLTTEEIGRMISSLKEELFKLRLKHSIGQLSKTAMIRNTRRSIARAHAVLKERS